MKFYLDKFIIKNLFGYKDINLDFNEPFLILVGENGSGKTTILNAIYYTLTKNFEELNKIKFESITMSFGSKKSISFTHNDIVAINEKEHDYQNTAFYRLISEKLKMVDIRMLEEIVLSDEIDSIKYQKVNRMLLKKGFEFHSTSAYIYENIKRLVFEYMAMDLRHKFESLDDDIEDSPAIFYFPTYRRVESTNANYSNLINRLRMRYPFIDSEDLTGTINSEIIRFGMSDVQKSIDRKTSDIKQKTMEGFSAIMGDMLSQLSKDSQSENIRRVFDKMKIEIILERLGGKIKDEDKKTIIDYAEKGKQNNTNLNYLIEKLIILYREQESIDNSIRNFTKTCNSYLRGKSFVYDEGNIDVYIKSEYRNDRLDLECLSSGEKQIISLFSNVYLTDSRSFIILFDEPELSLSLFWQEMLLQDIVNSGKCAFMLAVTHSPFIYNNDMKKYAKGISDFTILNK